MIKNGSTCVNQFWIVISFGEKWIQCKIKEGIMLFCLKDLKNVQEYYYLFPRKEV